MIQLSLVYFISVYFISSLGITPYHVLRSGSFLKAKGVHLMQRISMVTRPINTDCQSFQWGV